MRAWRFQQLLLPANCFSKHKKKNSLNYTERVKYIKKFWEIKSKPFVSKNEIKIKYLQKNQYVQWGKKTLKRSKLKNKKMKGNLLIFSSSISNTNYDFIYRIPIVEGNFIYIFMQSTKPSIIFNNLPGILFEILKNCSILKWCFKHSSLSLAIFNQVNLSSYCQKPDDCWIHGI